MILMPMVLMMIIWPPLVGSASKKTLVGLHAIWFTFVEFYLFVLRICNTLYFICTLSSSFCNLPYNPPREISKSKLTLRLKLQLHEKTLKLNIRRRVMSSADVARPEEQKQTLCNNTIWAIISPVSVCTFFYAFLPSFFLDEEYFCEAPF